MRVKVHNVIHVHSLTSEHTIETNLKWAKICAFTLCTTPTHPHTHTQIHIDNTPTHPHTHTHTHTQTQTGLVPLAVTLGSYFSHCFHKSYMCTNAHVRTHMTHTTAHTHTHTHTHRVPLQPSFDTAPNPYTLVTLSPIFFWSASGVGGRKCVWL